MKTQDFRGELFWHFRREWLLLWYKFADYAKTIHYSFGVMFWHRDECRDVCCQVSAHVGSSCQASGRRITDF